MNKDFQMLYEQFISKQITLIRFLDELRSVGDFSDDLLQVMKDAVAAQDWPRLNAMLHAAFLVPDRKFTFLLCDLLENYRTETDMEALADLLFDIRDERSVPALIRAFDYYLPVDDDYHFNRKVLDALHRIGTEEAIEIIKRAVHSPKALIRESAEHLLNRGLD
jgi:HEAT repeat protein